MIQGMFPGMKERQLQEVKITIVFEAWETVQLVKSSFDTFCFSLMAE